MKRQELILLIVILTIVSGLIMVYFLLGKEVNLHPTHLKQPLNTLTRIPNQSENSIQPRIAPYELNVSGPTKDGTPSIDHPKFIPIAHSPFPDSHTILGIYEQGIAKAYPYGILNWHEIINDTIGNLPITVTLSPLCDTTAVFVRKINNQKTTFGVSGKRYQGCLIMYDRKTGYLWSQVWGLGINGTANNLQLKRIPAVKTTLGQWKKKYPHSLLLSMNTSFKRNYFYYPYGNYNKARYLAFPVRHLQLMVGHPKTIETYIYIHDQKTPTNYFSGSSFRIDHEIAKREQIIEFTLAGQIYHAKWDNDLNTVKIYLGEKEIPSSTAFGFVYPSYFLR